MIKYRITNDDVGRYCVLIPNSYSGQESDLVIIEHTNKNDESYWEYKYSFRFPSGRLVYASDNCIKQILYSTQDFREYKISLDANKYNL